MEQLNSSMGQNNIGNSSGQVNYNASQSNGVGPINTPTGIPSQHMYRNGPIRPQDNNIVVNPRVHTQPRPSNIPNTRGSVYANANVTRAPRTGGNLWHGITSLFGRIFRELLHILARAVKIVLLLFAVLLVLVFIGVLFGKESGTLGGIESQVIHKGSDEDKEIAVVRLSGVITNTNRVETEIGSKAYTALLKQLAKKEEIKGIILVVDSPGGEVYAADELYGTLTSINKKIPVYVYAESLLASGAYYFSMGANKVYTSDLTIVGSIGVIMEMYNYDDLLNKVGIRVRKMTNTGGVYKTGDGLFDKDPNGPEDKLYQRILDATYMKFVNIVSKSRKLSKQKVISVADGRVMIASDARAIGLTDKISTFWGTVHDMEQAYKLGDIDVVEYYMNEEPTWLKPFASASAFVKLLTLKRTGETKLMYIYNH